VVSADGNVMGLMPHPEHAVDPLVGAGSTDGAQILGSLVDAVRERAGVSAAA
jgi:phosphoribosylformylglycinamidine synthase